MKYTAAEQNLIILSSIPELSQKERCAAISAGKQSGPDLAACKNSLIKRSDIGVYNKVEEDYGSPAFRSAVLEQLEERGIECVTLLSADYPAALKKIPDPPVTLFIKGRRELLSKKMFAIVGSRRSPAYATANCKNFSKELSKYFSVVSGFAAGADSAALEGADCRAVSVIAFGFDYLGGQANAALLKKVEQAGLLLSEHFPTVAPQVYLFPVRNRIIAGLSEGTLVVSAGKKSGALITASLAREYKRQVFAFPYNMGVSAGEGCNALIRDGAALCRNTGDILDFYGISPPKDGGVHLTDDEARVMEVLREEGEVFLPVLANKLGEPPYKLIPVLSSLEIKGLAVRLGGNRYSVL